MKRIYVDMDGVLCDYVTHAIEKGYLLDDACHHPGFFTELKPLPGAIEAFNKLCEKYDVYILSAGSWSNPLSYAEKTDWVKKYLPIAKKKVIFSCVKDVMIGDYLIDDRDTNGQRDFNGEWIEFGTAPFENWDKVLNYLMNKD